MDVDMEIVALAFSHRIRNLPINKRGDLMKEVNFYNEEELETEIEDDKIETEEQGFMMGYLHADEY